jgi:integrase
LISKNESTTGSYLTWGELDRLVDSFSWTQKKLRRVLVKSAMASIPRRVFSLESVRKSAPAMDDSQSINAETVATRLLYFRDFVKWKIDRSLYALSIDHENYLRLRDAKDRALVTINTRIPKGFSKSDLLARQGLSAEEISLLLEVVKLDSICNPWKSEFIRVRNRLIVHLLLSLGLRKGELLGIKIGDMNLEKNELATS